MTRRTFFAALLPGLGGATQASSGFVLTGHFDRAGEDPRHAYFALGQGLTLVIDPDRLPACTKGAEALIGGEAVCSLMKA